jgi:hypothetical protein
MTPWRSRLALFLALSALAGFTTPWSLRWLLGHLGSIETLLAERTIAHFPGARSGVHSYFTVVVPCIDALACAAVFGVPLGFIGGKFFFRGWLVFMASAITAHVIASQLAPAPFGGFATGISTIIHVPFWWLFALAFLGVLALTARSRRRVSYAA